MSEEEAINQLDAIEIGLNDGERLHEECERIVFKFIESAHPRLSEAIQRVKDDAAYWVFA